MKKVLCFLMVIAFEGGAFAMNDFLSQDNFEEVQANGYAGRGFLENATPLPFEDQDDKILKLSPKRNFHYGTAELVKLILHVADKMKKDYGFSERLQVGDLSAENGGKIPRHSSHQTGQDVDLAFYRVDSKEKGFVKYVENSSVLDDFDREKNWAMISEMVATGLVHSIFIDKAIREELCIYSKENDKIGNRLEVLNKMIHEPGHSDHLHVRILCTPGSSDSCKNQNMRKKYQDPC